MIKLMQINEDIDHLDKKEMDKVVVAMEDPMAADVLNQEEKMEKISKDLKPLVLNGEDLAGKTSAKKDEVHNVMHEDVEEEPMVDVEVVPEDDEKKDFGVDSCLNQLIRDTWEMVDRINGNLSTLADLGVGEEVMETLKEIVDDEMIHIGQLEAILPLGAPELEQVPEMEEPEEGELLIIK